MGRLLRCLLAFKVGPKYVEEGKNSVVFRI